MLEGDVPARHLNPYIEELDKANKANFYYRLRSVFQDHEAFPFKRKILFCPGTAPMREENSEISTILYSTDFDEAWMVDPYYALTDPVQWDVTDIKKCSDDGSCEVSQHPQGKTIRFQCCGKERVVHLLASDASHENALPPDFNVFFSGRRINPSTVPADFKPSLESGPKGLLKTIIDRLPVGGFFFPDRDCTDDGAKYFYPDSPTSLGLIEIPGIREDIVVSEYDHELFMQLLEQYQRTAIAAGLVRDLASIPSKEVFESFSDTEGNILLDEKRITYCSKEEYFTLHPELNRQDFQEDEWGVMREKNGMFVRILSKRTLLHFQGDEEQKYIEINTRAMQDAMVKKVDKGLGLYRKK